MQTPAFGTLDVQTHYNLTPSVTLRAAIGNLFNREAPLSFTQNTSTVVGVNTNLSSVWGRMLSLGVTARF